MYIFQFPLILQLLLRHLLMLEFCNIPVKQICVSCLIETWCFISVVYVIILVQCEFIELFENANGTQIQWPFCTCISLYIRLDMSFLTDRFVEIYHVLWYSSQTEAVSVLLLSVTTLDLSILFYLVSSEVLQWPSVKSRVTLISLRIWTTHEY